MTLETSLYFGSLPYDATEQMIRDILSPLAPVGEVKLAVDSVTGRFMGYAFVQLGSKEDLEKIIKELNEKEVGGRNCFLDLATNQKDLWERVFGN
jgi:RNA recognition motif-containing protein